MQCLAGLWWDQQRRACVLPSEVACNPYNIINSQGQNAHIDNNPNGKVHHCSAREKGTSADRSSLQ